MERIGRNTPCPCGSGKKYKHCCMRLATGWETAAPSVGRAEAHYNLANALRDQGRLDEAVASYRQALSLEPDYVEAHNNLGTVLQSLGKLSAAAASYRSALARRPQSHHLHYNLGNVLRDEGDLEQAVASYRRALFFRHDFADAHNNLGVALQRQGQLAEAVACYRTALSFNPRFAEAYYGLGTALQSQGHPVEALDCFSSALSLRPDLPEAHAHLGDALSALGQPDAALRSYRRALALTESQEFKARFAWGIRHADLIHADAGIRDLVIRALSEPWARPGDLAAAATSLLGANQDLERCVERAAKAWPTRLASSELFAAVDVEAWSGDQLFQCLLENAPIPDIAMEQFLTMVRPILLESAAGAEADPLAPGSLAFHCALARQCFINDFVFAHTADELARVTILRDRLVAALQSGAPVPARWLPAVGSYFPLFTLQTGGDLWRRPWPEPVEALLTQQVAEPLEERRLRREIPRLTVVSDLVSGQVQQQYEESPYPRWIKVPPPGEALAIDAYVAQHFPLSPFRRFNGGGYVDILVAGCGTGREPIELARQFAGARVLAVDLSLSSLSYALRKTRELGLGNVEYAQADLTRLSAMGRTFDLISAVGVLHHLVDPMAGWRELLSSLRAGGLMLVGLYSERARENIAMARKLIAERGYAADPAGIGLCRQVLTSLEDGNPLKEITSFNDFYVTSECRDLLFHVQEHCFTLPELKADLQELGLNFLGFFLEPDVLNRYAASFPEDITMTNLDSWHEFEKSFPRTFAAMYVFLVQKAV